MKRLIVFVVYFILTSPAWGSQIFQGSITGNAATVTTNANLTGDVTSAGNATTIKEAPVVKAITLTAGSELVSNGAAWTGASGATPPNSWTVVNAGLWDIVDDGGAHTTALRAKVDSTPTANPRIKTSFVTQLGHIYKFSFDIKRTNGALYLALSTTDLGGGDIGAWNGLNDGAWTSDSIIFTATTATTYFDFFLLDGTDGEYSYVDTVSLKEIPMTVSGDAAVAGTIQAGGGSASSVTCWKADGKTLGYATVAEITAGTCH